MQGLLNASGAVTRGHAGLPEGSDLYGDALALCIFFLDVAATDRIDAVREEQPHNPTKKMMFKGTPNQI
jgi:hypothetical protein